MSTVKDLVSQLPKSVTDRILEWLPDIMHHLVFDSLEDALDNILVAMKAHHKECHTAEDRRWHSAITALECVQAMNKLHHYHPDIKEGLAFKLDYTQRTREPLGITTRFHLVPGPDIPLSQGLKLDIKPPASQELQLIYLLFDDAQTIDRFIVQLQDLKASFPNQ